MNRVASQLGVGNVSLNPFDTQLSAERSTSAVFHHVTKGVNRSGLAHNAPIQRLPARLQGLHDFHRAVHRGAFLVTGQQKSQREVRIGFGLKKRLCGNNHGRKRCLHVTGSAPKQFAIAVGGRERVAEPFAQRPGRDHVGVTGKHHGRCLRCRAGPHSPKVADLGLIRPLVHAFTDKTKCLQALRDQGQTPCVLRGHGRASDELLDQIQGG